MLSNPEEDVYEALMNVWRQEKGEEKPSKLPDDLAEKLRGYIGSIKHYLKVSDRSSLTSEFREAAVEAVTRLVREIFELRLRKLLESALKEEGLENLFMFERRIYPSLVSLIKEYRENVEELVAAAAYQDWEKLSSKYELVCFLKDVPQFVGSDLEIYGPYKAGDLATLPPENARNLELANIVRPIRVLQPKLREG
ncbi:MAG: DNA replication complex GINS family protein [Thaumarchaeota archaeon]|nr:DNA replication complex GINS family protein [Nitrososphaerota archaeon]